MTGPKDAQYGQGAHEGFERRPHGQVIAPLSQTLLVHPGQAEALTQPLLERYPEGQTALDPLTGVFAHVITMPLLSDLSRAPIAFPVLQQSDEEREPIISSAMRIGSRVPFPGFNYGVAEDSAFVSAQLDRIYPYFATTVRNAMNTENTYAPIWQQFKNIGSVWAPHLITQETNPEYQRAYREYDFTKPGNLLFAFFWEASSVIPTHVKEVAPLIYSDSVETVGQFQQQAIERGVVGLMARASEMAKGAREKKREGIYLSQENFEQDPETGIINWGGSLTRGINAGISRCVAPFGLLSPKEEIRIVSRLHNGKMGDSNRSSSSFIPLGEGTNPLDIVAAAAVIGYTGILDAPSTIWHPFLQSKGITDYSDALPGTRLPDGRLTSGSELPPIRILKN